MNAEGMNLLKSFEGLRLTAYQDSGGIWTIGYGCTMGACEGMIITKVTADIWLMKEVKELEEHLKSEVKVPLNSNQLSALICIAYNIGISNFRTSTLLKKLNSMDYLGAANEFLKWDKAKGNILPGLTKRRHAERDLFLKEEKINE